MKTKMKKKTNKKERVRTGNKSKENKGKTNMK